MKHAVNHPDARINVAVIESDPLRLAGFRALLECHEDLRIGALTMSEIRNLGDPDVVLLGKRSNENLSFALQCIRSVKPDVRVIVIASGGTESALEALAEGAKGYIDEASPAEEFLRAIRVVNQGLVWASRGVLAQFVERSTSRSPDPLGSKGLTKREREVLEMLVDGRSNKEIALPLGIEERTVKAHVAKLMRKVGVRNRIMLSVHAVNRSLVSPR